MIWILEKVLKNLLVIINNAQGLNFTESCISDGRL